MKRKLSPWCKEVKKTLIDRDMSVTELCGEVGMCRNYPECNGQQPGADQLARNGQNGIAECYRKGIDSH